MLNIHSLGQGSAVVFFHGWGFDHTIWYPIADALKENFTLYLVDLPGFGHSRLVNWSIFKAYLLDALPEQFALVGWSLGGLFATRLAIEAPGQVTHLLNIASSPYFIRDARWPGIAPEVFDTFLTRLLSNPQKTTQQFIDLQMQHVAKTPVISPLSSIDGLESGLNVLKTWDLRAQLAQLTMPVSYFFGRLDAIVPRTLLASMQKIYPHMNYLLFDNAAHMPFLSDEQACITAMERFFQ